jgi:hypothetical protein
VGDLVIGNVCLQATAFSVLLVCLEPPKSRQIADLNIKVCQTFMNQFYVLPNMRCASFQHTSHVKTQGIVLQEDIISLGDGPLQGYEINDLVRCEVTYVDRSNSSILLGMKGHHASSSLLHQVALGKITEKSLPLTYK